MVGHIAEIEGQPLSGPDIDKVSSVCSWGPTRAGTAGHWLFELQPTGHTPVTTMLAAHQLITKGRGTLHIDGSTTRRGRLVRLRTAQEPQFSNAERHVRFL